MNKKTLLAATLTLLAGSAEAGPADDARAHFDAIARGDVEAIMAQYGDGAMFQWVGGPLDGHYQGDQIRTVWSKFAGNAPLKARISGEQVNANPKGATVTANVVFEGKKPIPVRYILVYRGDRLVSEVWQIDPGLATAY
jgi:ketosteroid isomerase-like protein